LDIVIEFKLSKANYKIKIEFYRSGWTKQTEFLASCNFSWARYFISLRDYLEKATGDPYVQVKNGIVA
jgi:hypothetical protein